MADITSKAIKVHRYGAVPRDIESQPMAAVAIQAGQLVMLNATGYAIGALLTASNAYAARGFARLSVDNSAGSPGDLRIELETDYYLDNDSTNPITQAMLGRSYCYAVDNHTVGSSDVAGSLSLVGVPVSLGVGDLAGKVAVRVGVATPYAVNPLLAGSSSAAFKAHVVATNLAALTFTAGSFSADANGALATQDGITVGSTGIAASNVIIFPTGTITTGVVSAANSGPWVLTSVGGASAKFTGVRPDWYPHGGNVPAAPIEVSAGALFGNTRWKPYADTLVAATPLVIGTSDPKFRPVQVTQTVTLSSSAATITNVPIHSATRSNVVASLSAVGGTTTSTIGWGIIVAPTAGDLGTASTVVNAIASGGTKNGSSDTSVLLVTITNG